MEQKISFKIAKTAYRALKSGRSDTAAEVFLRLSGEGNKYALVGYIGLAAAEASRQDYSSEKITEYLSKAAGKSFYAAELSGVEKALVKKLVNNSCFPEYRLPLMYFAEQSGSSDLPEFLISLGAETDAV